MERIVEYEIWKRDFFWIQILLYPILCLSILVNIFHISLELLSPGGYLVFKLSEELIHNLIEANNTFWSSSSDVAKLFFGKQWGVSRLSMVRNDNWEIIMIVKSLYWMYVWAYPIWRVNMWQLWAMRIYPAIVSFLPRIRMTFPAPIYLRTHGHTSI